MGHNAAQRLLLLTGTARAGKSTLQTIIEKIVGLENVRELRTEHLGERFELHSFVGKTLLNGKDVKPDFLQQKGASKIKSLVGGDYLSCEKKGGAHIQIKGDYNMVITCNSSLRVHLDGDVGAWGRRLLAIHYDQPPTAQRISEFADLLIREEGPGILNFFVQGAIEHLEELAATGDYQLSLRQQQRIDNILRESDSVRHFVLTCVFCYPGNTVTNHELNQAYYAYCARQKWHPYASAKVNGMLHELMLELRQAHERHDIVRAGGNQQRGYSGVAIQAEGQ